MAAGEIATTLNKFLAAGGSPYVAAATDPTVCSDDTVSGRIINILIPVTGGIGWLHAEPA